MMRISFNGGQFKGHDGQHLRRLLESGYGARLVIRLDGKELDKVVGFDTREGIVKRFVTDGDGRVLAHGGEAQTEELLGTVTVELVDL